MTYTSEEFHRIRKEQGDRAALKYSTKSEVCPICVREFDIHSDDELLTCTFGLAMSYHHYAKLAGEYDESY